MMGNFFNNMYYGKNRSDFTSDHLPKNRLHLFFEMLRIRFFKLMHLNLIMMAFALPFVVCIVFFLVMVPNATPPEQMNLEFVYNLIINFCIFNVPCCIIYSLGQVGLTYVARNWARDEHAWIWGDFKDAIKTNWKQALITGTAKGIFILASVWAAFFYWQMSAVEGNLYFVMFCVLVVVMFVLAMADLYIWPTMITYELKLRHVFRNSVIMALARLPWSVLFLIIQALPVLLVFFIPNGIVSLVVGLYYVLIGFAMTTFINVSYTNAAFDKLINPHIEGAVVNRGLRPDEDDDEYEDDDE